MLSIWQTGTCLNTSKAINQHVMFNAFAVIIFLLLYFIDYQSPPIPTLPLLQMQALRGQTFLSHH